MMASNGKLVLLILALGVSVSRASRGFMVLEEGKQRDSSQDPAQILYQLFNGAYSNGSGHLAQLPGNVRQLFAQPMQGLISQPPTFGSMGNQLDGLLSTGYDQVTRRLQQVQQGVPNLDDGERLLMQMYEMLVNPEEMCRNLAQQALNPALKFALDQSQTAIKTAQSVSPSASVLEPANSLLNRFTSLGKK